MVFLLELLATLHATLHNVLRRSWSSRLVVTASTSEFVSETRMRRALDTGALPREERGGLLLLFIVVLVVVETAAWQREIEASILSESHQILTDDDQKARAAVLYRVWRSSADAILVPLLSPAFIRSQCESHRNFRKLMVRCE